MRLLSFRTISPDGPVQRAGALLEGDPGAAVDLTTAYYGYLLDRGGIEPAAARRIAHALAPPDMVAFLEGGEHSIEAARHALDWAASAGGFTADGACVLHDTATLDWLPPVPRPPLVRDCLAFEEHLKKFLKIVGSDTVPVVWYDVPIYYKASPLSLVGHGADVEWPQYSSLLDYELEFACVIGRSGRDIPQGEARRYIAGYTVFNDFSARDVQGKEMTGLLGPAKGKDFHTGNAMGPVLVTPDELPDPYSLTMTARINGQVWSEGSSSAMHWRFEDMIAYISRSEVLRPGEIIGSGTVGGGSGLEHGRFLSPGDVVELTVEGIGTLRNRIVRREGGAER